MADDVEVAALVVAPLVYKDDHGFFVVDVVA